MIEQTTEPVTVLEVREWDDKRTGNRRANVSLRAARDKDGLATPVGLEINPDEGRKLVVGQSVRLRTQTEIRVFGNAASVVQTAVGIVA